MKNEFRSRSVLLISVLILVSASSLIIVEGGVPQSLDASSDTSTAVTLGDGFTLSTTGSGTTSGYTIVVVVPDHNGASYKNYTVSFTGTFTVPTNPSYGSFSSDTTAVSGSGDADGTTGEGSKTVKYTAKDGATRAQIGADLSSITYSGAGTVTVTVTDEGASSPQTTKTYESDSIGNNVYVSTIGGGPKHYTSLSDAYNDESYTNPTIRFLTDVIQNDTLEIKKNLKITSDSSSQVCSIKHSDDSSKTILKVTNGAVVLKDITIDGNKQGSDFLVIVGSEDGTSPPTLTLDSGSTVKDGAAGGILLGLKTKFLVTSYGSLYIQGGAVIEGNTGGCFTYLEILKCWVGGIGVTGNTTFVMNGGEIRNNVGASAGGVAFCGNKDGSAEMNGGSITCNTSSDGAGAILVNYHGKLCLNGGTITENKSCGAIGAVTVVKSLNVPYWFYIGGFADGNGAPLKIYENYDAVGVEKNLLLHTYVAADRVSGVLAEGSRIGVSVESWPSEKVSDVNVVGGSTVEEASYFKSDDLVIAGIIREEGTGVIKLSYEDRGQDIVYVSSGGNDVSGNGTVGRPFKTLARAYELVRDNGKIYLKSDIETGDCLTVESKNITITSITGSTFSVTRTSDTNLIYIKSGLVTLEDVTLTDKDGKNGQRLTALVCIASKDGKGESTEVVATLVLGNGSTVKDVGMAKGGSSNEKGIILVYLNGKLTMEDGATIQDCKADSGSVYCFTGIFEMSGGTISGCDSQSVDGGAAVGLSRASTMTMSGGTIRECGSGSSECAGTVHLDGLGYNTFRMSGGSITNNTAMFGGGVYSDSRVFGDSNIIEVSGSANIDGNKNTSGGNSNIHLTGNQYIKITGNLSENADLGVYTASEFTGDVKVAEFANGVTTDGYASHIHSDKPAVAGLKLDGSTLYLSLGESTALVKFGSLPEWAESIGGGLTQNVAGTGGDTEAIDPIGLVSKSGYVELTEKQADAVKTALNGKGLKVVLFYGAIVINGTPTDKVDVNLATILKDLEPEVAQATLKDWSGSTVWEYATISEALSDADAISGLTIVVNKPEGTELTPVVGGTLKQGVALKIGSGTYRADGGDATIDVDGDGNVTLSGGKLEAAGGAVSVPMSSGSENLKVTVPQDKTYTIDAGNSEVSGLAAEDKVEIGDLEYISKNGGSFKICGKNSGILVSGGDAVIVPSGKMGMIMLGNGTGAPTISVPAEGTGNSGEVKITKTSTGATVKAASSNDTFKAGDSIFTAGSSDAEFAIDADGNVKIVEGSAILNDGDSILTAGGRKVANPSGSSDDEVTVQSGATADGPAKISVPSNGSKVKIDDDEYEASGTGATFTVDKDRNVLLVGGSVKSKDSTISGSEGKEVLIRGAHVLEKGGSAIGLNGNAVKNSSDSDIKITMEADWTAGTNVVIIPKDGIAEIDSAQYVSAQNGTKILIDAGKNVLESGAVKVGKDKEISVGDSRTVVKGLADGDDKKVTVTAKDGGSGSVSIPAGGKAEVGGTSIEATGTGITVEIGKDGKISMTIDPGNAVNIGGTAYTGSSPRGSKISIDPDTGSVTAYDVRKIVIDTGTGYSFDIDCGKGETIALPTGREPGHAIEREGHVLVGWRSADSQSSTKDYGLGSDYTVGEDESLSAIWVENEDVVVYYTDNGGSIVGSTYAALDDGIASLDSTVTKGGYAFLGWTATDSAGNKVAYASGLTVEASGTMYMTAYLVPESSLSGLCTVRYDSGYGAEFRQYADSGVYVSLPTARDMHRDGYTFLGWEVEGTLMASMAVSLGAETGDRVSGTYLVSGDVTFTAVWAAEGSDDKPWWDDDDDPYIPYHPSSGGSSDGSMDTVLIVAVASVAVLLLLLMVLSSHRRS